MVFKHTWWWDGILKIHIVDVAFAYGIKKKIILDSLLNSSIQRTSSSNLLKSSIKSSIKHNFDTKILLKKIKRKVVGGTLFSNVIIQYLKRNINTIS